MQSNQSTSTSAVAFYTFKPIFCVLCHNQTTVRHSRKLHLIVKGNTKPRPWKYFREHLYFHHVNVVLPGCEFWSVECTESWCSIAPKNLRGLCLKAYLGTILKALAYCKMGTWAHARHKSFCCPLSFSCWPFKHLKWLPPRNHSDTAGHSTNLFFTLYIRFLGC